MIENPKEQEAKHSEDLKDVELIDNVKIEKEDYTENLILKCTAFEKLFNLSLMKVNAPETLVLSEDRVVLLKKNIQTIQYMLMRKQKHLS